MLYSKEWKDEPKDQGVCCEIESPSNIRSYTHKDSPTWPLKPNLNKDDTNEHAKLQEAELKKKKKKKKRGIKDAVSAPHKELQAPKESWSPPRKSTLVHISSLPNCQTVSPEHVHTKITVQTQQAVLRKIYVYIYTVAVTNRKDLKERGEGHMKGLEGRKGRRKML